VVVTLYKPTPIMNLFAQSSIKWNDHWHAYRGRLYKTLNHFFNHYFVVK
jgi:hypothetical protein